MINDYLLEIFFCLLALIAPWAFKIRYCFSATCRTLDLNKGKLLQCRIGAFHSSLLVNEDSCAEWKIAFGELGDW